jgi:type VI secretion system secreted protein Hcp
MNRFCYSIVAASAFLLLAQSGQAQPMYAKFEGVEGEATLGGYEGWVEVDEFMHGMQLSVDIGSIGGGGLAGRPEHFAVQLVKDIDRSTPHLADALNRGAPFARVTVDFLTAEPGSAVWYLRMDMQEVYVTSYESTASVDGSRLREVFRLLYAKVEVTYREFDSQGRPAAEHVWGWDVSQGTPLSVEMESRPEVLVDGADVLFRWTTRREEGNYGFEIQHQEEGEFRRAAYVPGAGWSSQPLEYEVRIRGLDEGVHVFRLAQLRLGGSIAYSEEMVVAIGVPEGRSVVLDAPFPNPVHSAAFVDVAADGTADLKVSVLDVLGREVGVIYDGSVSSGRKSRFMFQPERMGLSSGLYVISASDGRHFDARTVSVVR